MPVLRPRTSLRPGVQTGQVTKSGASDPRTRPHSSKDFQNETVVVCED